MRNTRKNWNFIYENCIKYASCAVVFSEIGIETPKTFLVRYFLKSTDTFSILPFVFSTAKQYEKEDKGKQ